MKTAVLSDGGWGTAIALLLIRNGHEVTLWGPFADYVDEMRRTGHNDRFLPGVALPAELKLTADIREAVAEAELIVHASPTQYARGTLTKLAESGAYAGQIIVNVAKGIEVGTTKRLSEICADVLENPVYSCLSGPSHAEEVVNRAPTLVVVAAESADVAATVQDAFHCDSFRVYTSADVIGVELGGALKNVFALAAGICDGMQLGDNAKAALITRGIAEMSRLGVACGGHTETFSGLSGVGDMIVTCTSGHSRNRHVGEELGHGKSLEEISAGMGLVVAEGVRTAESAFELAQRLNVDTPIINEIYAGLYENKDMRQGVRDLMTRQPKHEGN
jgi:glycerol-3-phosphate dehydrogenase (NAD(P)+)